ncbi:glycosyltransferase [Tessaracoccus sp. ZS01]|uniref:glycosyltransferase n=1 Tax=Tessaracoccus sp. ZS01 TaxID=1906324 RepID=UPI00096D5B1F|nr:glycosyltransferase [Tessaracoccus sp. ZS01]MCG6568068.1 hypothetical protein [Tessaracoccus sp. ZS01]OMG54147.1 hypothetical protein BJN44_10635 [Tessaracoccus sp. ZS01]
MRVLVISSHFPPEPVIGSVRPSRIASFLRSQGHHVIALTKGGPWGRDRGDGSDVVRTPWIRLPILRYIRPGLITQAPPPPAVGAQGSGGGPLGRARKWISRLAHELLSFPDQEGGWIPFAYLEGGRILADEKIDVILASGPSFASHLIASALARRYSVPWVADYRDLWTTGDYYAFSSLRRRIDSRVERRILAGASATTAIGDTMARHLTERFSISSTVVRNGADDVTLRPLGQRVPLSSARVNLLYVGNNFYGGRRSPLLLFRAARALSLTPSEIRFHFLGSDPDLLATIIDAEGVRQLVQFHDPVGHDESLEIQGCADMLILLLWDDPREAGTLPAKLFEYAAARRPVVLVGYVHGEAAHVVKDNRLGWMVDDLESACEVMVQVLRTKPSASLLADLPEAKQLSRKGQLKILEGVLCAVADSGSSNVRGAQSKDEPSGS